MATVNGFSIDNNDNESTDDTDDSEAVLNDSDSGFQDATPSTSSVQPGVYNFDEVHGRLYHGYHRGKYKFPCDVLEQERMANQHHAMRLALNDIPYFAPIERPHNILDIGTGTGLWALNVADENPQAIVTGIDLSPIMPAMVPPNLFFEINDADENWTFSHSFDLVHCRFMNDFTLRSWPHYFSQAYDRLLPGGWVECQEYDYHRLTDDDTIPRDSKLKAWEDEMTRGMQRVGLQGYCDPALVMQQMRDAGLVNTTVRVFKMPLGPWPRDPVMKECGEYALMNIIDGLYGSSVKIFKEYLDYSEDDLATLLDQCQREACQKGIHSYYPVYVIMGQKPYQPFAEEGDEPEA